MVRSLCVLWACLMGTSCARDPWQLPPNRQEVVFWHFWGGAEREIVENVARRFNHAQQQYHVRPIAMPGNNLDLKLFLAITGEDPPDVVNQDDPILADWARRGAILPLSAFVEVEELDRLADWLFPAAWTLAAYEDQPFALCNGLDVRALIYNQSLLEERGIAPPETIDQLDRLAASIAQPGTQDFNQMGFFPNPRNLWAWGIVFGGNFYDKVSRQITLDDPQIIRALDWMAGYGRRYGEAAVSFRARDQSLPGQTFPLLAGRYAAVVDGQWRVNDIRAAQQAERAAGQPVTEYGVVPLPTPPGGRDRAGWINGNFFIVPRGAANPKGAWEFMKFWSGFGGRIDMAAETAAAGGWIPVSPEVAEHATFIRYLEDHPLFATFVELAGSPHQIPRPNIPGAARLDREVRTTAEAAMFQPDSDPRTLLEAANDRLNRNLQGLTDHPERGAP